MEDNLFKRAARARKVLALLAVVPFGKTRAEIDSIADALQAASPQDRAWLARVAATHIPSATTWAMLVEQARARRPGTKAARFNRRAFEQMGAAG